MFRIILLLLLLSLLLYSFTKKEGLDNCDSPPIKGSTSTDITNSHQISKLQTQINSLDSDLRKQVAANTANINNLNKNVENMGNLRQILANLTLSIKKSESAIQQLGVNLQNPNLNNNS
jgi:hypothetical protein